jgi:hypothetical protein
MKSLVSKYAEQAAFWAGVVIVGLIICLVAPPYPQSADAQQPVVAWNGTLTDYSGALTAGGVAQAVAPANSARRYILVENVSAANEWFNFSVTATQTEPSFELIPGASFVMESTAVSIESISVIGPNTGQAYVVKTM